MTHLRNASLTVLIMLVALAYGSCGEDPEIVAATATACARESFAYRERLDDALQAHNRAWATVEAGPQFVAQKWIESAERLGYSGIPANIQRAKEMRQEAKESLTSSPEWQVAMGATNAYHSIESIR